MRGRPIKLDPKVKRSREDTDEPLGLYSKRATVYLVVGCVLLGKLLVPQVPKANNVMPSAVHIRLGVATWTSGFFGKYNDPLARVHFNLKHLAATLADQFPISTVHWQTNR